MLEVDSGLVCFYCEAILFVLRTLGQDVACYYLRKGPCKSGVLWVDVLVRCVEKQPMTHIPLAVCSVGY